MSSHETPEESSTDANDQFRGKLEELLDEPVDEETAEQIAGEYPDYVVASPECVDGALAGELSRFAKLHLADDVVRVTRRTDDAGNLARLHVVIGGEEPNTSEVREQILSKNLLFTGAGIHDGRLHLHFNYVEMEVA